MIIGLVVFTAVRKAAGGSPKEATIWGGGAYIGSFILLAYLTEINPLVFAILILFAFSMWTINKVMRGRL